MLSAVYQKSLSLSATAELRLPEVHFSAAIGAHHTLLLSHHGEVRVVELGFVRLSNVPCEIVVSITAILLVLRAIFIVTRLSLEASCLAFTGFTFLTGITTLTCYKSGLGARTSHEAAHVVVLLRIRDIG